MNNAPVISVGLVVLNGNRYISRCLEALQKQTFNHADISVRILDNGSTDGTIAAVEELLRKFNDFHSVKFEKSSRNYGMWGGQERLWNSGAGQYILLLSVDVIMDPGFIREAVAVMESDSKIGAFQGKTYQFSIEKPGLNRETIDTCGFKIFRSRRVVNIGHGEKDRGQYDTAGEVFGVEGAVPVFRREALESIRVFGEIADHDLFWYAEDLDVAWRVRLAGWKEQYDPRAVAWHDRQTSRSNARGGWWNYLPRVAGRRKIPIRKRRLEWRNTRWTLVKNDYIINILKDLPFILWREIKVFGYTVLFEPGVFAEVPEFFRKFPVIFRKRRYILAHAKASPEDIRRFFS